MSRPANRLSGAGAALRAYLPGLGFILVCLAILEACVRSGQISPAIAPLPTTVLTRFGALAATGELFGPVLHTVGLVIAGWLGAVVVGVLAGLMMGFDRRIHALLEPLVELIRPIPKPALLPPLMLLLGLGIKMEIAMVFIGALFPVLIATTQAVRAIDPVQIDVGRTLRVGRLRLLYAIVIPASLSMIMSGMKVSLSLAIVLAVLSEMLTGSYGLGATIMDLQRSFRVNDMYAWVLALALVGMLLARGFEWLEKKIVFWHGSA
jgi:ABC-type nitrate/sulfonate/bicarbonate transport system permease component